MQQVVGVAFPTSNLENIFVKCLYKADPQKFRSTKMSYHVIIISEKYIRMYASLGANNYFRRSIYIRMKAWEPGNKASDVVCFHSAPHDG